MTHSPVKRTGSEGDPHSGATGHRVPVGKPIPAAWILDVIVAVLAAVIAKESKP